MPANLGRPYGDRIVDALDAICAAISTGSTIKLACQHAGFSDDSLRQYWKAHPEVELRIRQAEAIRDERPAKRAYEGACEEPLLALKWLEKRQPEEWAPAPAGGVNVAITNVNAQLVNGKPLEQLSDAEIDQYLSAPVVEIGEGE